MKKVLLAAAVVAFFASCKKDYTCTCTGTSITYDLNGNLVTSTTTSTENYSSVSGANANLLKASCESKYTSTPASSYTSVCVWEKK
jgi:hypothetical protein